MKVRVTVIVIVIVTVEMKTKGLGFSFCCWGSSCSAVNMQVKDDLGFMG